MIHLYIRSPSYVFCCCVWYRFTHKVDKEVAQKSRGRPIATGGSGDSCRRYETSQHSRSDIRRQCVHQYVDRELAESDDEHCVGDAGLFARIIFTLITDLHLIVEHR